MPYPIRNAREAAGVERGCALAIMVKVPERGAVKTRLVPPLTPREAAALSVCFLRDTANNIADVAAEAACPVEGVAVYTPLGAEYQLECLLPERFGLLPQHGESFGDRLARGMQDLLTAGFGSACLINSDSPTLPADVLRSAVAALSGAGDRVVLGPSEDGGYYLIGLKHAHLRLFEDIAWSTSSVFAQTLVRAAEISLEVQLLPVWYDVDRAVELGYLCDELFGSNGRLSAGRNLAAYAAPHTRSYLAGLIEKDGCERIWPAAARKPRATAG